MPTNYAPTVASLRFSPNRRVVGRALFESLKPHRRVGLTGSSVAVFMKKMNAQGQEGRHAPDGSPFTPRPEDLFWLTVSVQRG